MRDLSPGLGSLTQGSLALDGTFGFSVRPHYANCCGTDNPGWDPSELIIDGIGGAFGSEIDGTDECNGDLENISPDFTDWWSADTSVATVTNKKVQAVSTGTTTGSASGDVFEGVGSFCAYDPVQANVPIKVQVPTSLSVVSVTVLPNGQGAPYGCGGNANYGIKVDTQYQVLDQNTQPIQSANMTPHEHATLFSGAAYDNPIGPVSGYPTRSATTASDGTRRDIPRCAVRGLRKWCVLKLHGYAKHNHHHARRVVS